MLEYTCISATVSTIRRNDIVSDGDDVFSVGGRSCSGGPEFKFIMHYKASTPSVPPAKMIEEAEGKKIKALINTVIRGSISRLLRVALTC